MQKLSTLLKDLTKLIVSLLNFEFSSITSQTLKYIKDNLKQIVKIVLKTKTFINQRP